MNFLKIITSFIIIYLFAVVNFYAQEVTSYTIKWLEPIEFGLEGDDRVQRSLYFEGAIIDYTKEVILPEYLIEFDDKTSQNIKNVKIINASYAQISQAEAEILGSITIPTEISVEITNSIIRKKRASYVNIIPLRNNNGRIEKLVSFDLDYSLDFNRLRNSKSLSFASSSILADGDFYKIAVTEKGVFKLDALFLKKLGVDISSINPLKIQLFGNGGGMLPEDNSIDRYDDLIENNIQVSGEEDGSFDQNDYILFYGENQVKWNYDSARDLFRHELNHYSDTSYYFIRFDYEKGKRISTVASNSQTPTRVVDIVDNYFLHEVDEVNLLKSGRLWLGEIFDNTLTHTFQVDFSKVDVNDTANIELSVAARSDGGANSLVSVFTTRVNDLDFTTSVSQVNINQYAAAYANFSRSFFEFKPERGNQFITISYNKPSEVSRGWLNSLVVNYRENLEVRNSQTFFRDTKSVGNGNVGDFRIASSSSDLKVWELTDKFNIKEWELTAVGNLKSFVTSTENLKEFVAFDQLKATGVFPMGRVVNQNLHGQPLVDMVIVTHPSFLNDANRLAGFHRNEGLKVNVATTNQIYNEFSSGSPDIIAIRSYFKMFYDRASSDEDRIKYALLFGDASYDYKNKVNGNTNFVLAYQSDNSTVPVDSYVSDDFVGFLDDTEGRWVARGSDRLDLGIGRLPIKNTKESREVVDKIISYYSNSTYDSWRNEIVFVADDGDNRRHMIQANNLSAIVERDQKQYNTKKIFIDAYSKQSTSGGNRYPQARKELNEAVNKGALIINYTGHGGETGWTSERILGVSDILAWNNSNSLPLFLTATCEFSRFDDPLRTSGGEMVLLNPKGGGIGLFTTTRLVYSTPNFHLNSTFYFKAFDELPGGGQKRLGDIFMEMKNSHATDPNSRNFTFLGDPALFLATPELDNVTTTVNGKPISNSDTLNALSKTTIVGYVVDDNGQKITDFNGIMDVAVFDKIESKKTLNNSGDGVFSYSEQSNRLFQGKVSVNKGDYEFSFVVPKDISYNIGTGKISYYFTDNQNDGNGFTNEVFIGGSNPNAIEDNQGPDMELFMNDKSFIYGGITNNNPVLLVELADEQGINTVGSGIGHDLVAVLDENTEDAFILNDYYEAEIDDYSKGKITFPFDELTEGKHTLRVKAWDVANNSSERTIEFTVMEDREVEIDNVVNYPNPFTTNTEFIFQHNQAGVPMDVKLEIFTVSGKLVKSFNETIVNNGFLSRDIRWDGRDDFGDRIGKGVYVYKILVRSRNGSSTEKFEKLVIL